MYKKLDAVVAKRYQETNVYVDIEANYEARETRKRLTT